MVVEGNSEKEVVLKFANLASDLLKKLLQMVEITSSEFKFNWYVKHTLVLLAWFMISLLSIIALVALKILSLLLVKRNAKQVLI
jgi:hypothetical protein